MHSLYQIAVCDDDPLLLQQVADLLHTLLSEEHISGRVQTFLSAEALLQAIEPAPHTFHLLILDILMDGMNGMCLAELLRGRGVNAQIVFLSSNTEYALQGYEVNAARYLAKPVRQDRLREALLHCYRHSSHLLQPELGLEGEAPLLPDDICYIATVGNGDRGLEYVLSNRRIPAPGRLVRLEKELDFYGFVRCHQSFLVNLKYVERLRRYELLLQNGESLPVGKQRYDAVRAKLLAYLSDPLP